MSLPLSAAENDFSRVISTPLTRISYFLCFTVYPSRMRVGERGGPGPAGGRHLRHHEQEVGGLRPRKSLT